MYQPVTFRITCVTQVFVSIEIGLKDADMFDKDNTQLSAWNKLPPSNKFKADTGLTGVENRRFFNGGMIPTMTPDIEPTTGGVSVLVMT